MPAAVSTTRGALLSVEGVSKRFGARTALRPVSFAIQPGEIVAVIGPNGAGKTTLLSILAGVFAPTEGHLTRASDRPVGWVPQQPAVYSKLSVTENLQLFARLEKLPDPDAAAGRMLAQIGLEDRAQDELGTLSGGNQQRVNIGVGLLSEPDALLLDEPSASLDPRQRERLWQFITTLAGHGTAVLFATHNIVEVERYATRVLVLVDGELLFGGTPGELEETVGGSRDLEAAFVRFLHERGH
jgi:ABC-2 type transport system ATP-binding protein